MTATRPLRATYASSPESGVIEGVRPRPAVDAGDGATVDTGRHVAPEPAELGVVIDDFMRAAEEGEAEDGYGEQYTIERLRELHRSLSHVKSELGTMRIDAVGRWHVQGMLDELRRAGLAPGRLTAIVEALDSLYRYAILRGLVEDSPVIWLTFPQYAEGVRAPTTQVRPPRPEPEFAEASTPPAMLTSVATSAPGETPTPTQAMLALGGRVLLWTMRVIVTIFVLVAIVLIVEFA